MLKKIGYVLGGLLLLDGVWGTVSPRFGIETWKRNFRRYMPRPVSEDVEEFSHLSDSAIRYIAVWLGLAGLVMLLLASRIRE